MKAREIISNFEKKKSNLKRANSYPINLHQIESESSSLTSSVISRKNIAKKQQNSIQNLSQVGNVSDDERDAFFIYTQATPCLFCASNYFKLAKKFSSIDFYVYFTVLYKNENYDSFMKEKYYNSYFYEKCKKRKRKVACLEIEKKKFLEI